MAENMKIESEETIQNLESRLAVAEADNAALLQVMREECYQPRPQSLYSACLYCGGNRPEVHEPNCILSADHPGSRILELLEAAEECVEFLRDKRTRTYHWRVKREALAAYDKAKEPSE